MSPSLAASFRWPGPEGGPDVFRQELFAVLKFTLNYLMVTAAPENLSEARCARWFEGLAGIGGRTSRADNCWGLRVY